MNHGRKEADHLGEEIPCRKPNCLCGQAGIRNDTYDAYYCPASGVWLEAACEYQDCSFCSNRPELAPASEA